MTGNRVPISEGLFGTEHDPMCPQYDCWLEGCTVCDECALIARVREDERDNCWSAVAEIYPDELFNGVKTAWWVEKEAALAAIDALRGSGNPDTPPSAEKGERA